MLEEVWETFNGLFKVAHAQGRRIEEHEARIASLERLLRDRDAEVIPERPILRVVERDEIQDVPA